MSSWKPYSYQYWYCCSMNQKMPIFYSGPNEDVAFVFKMCRLLHELHTTTYNVDWECSQEPLIWNALMYRMTSIFPKKNKFKLLYMKYERSSMKNGHNFISILYCTQIYFMLRFATLMCYKKHIVVLFNFFQKYIQTNLWIFRFFQHCLQETVNTLWNEQIFSWVMEILFSTEQIVSEKSTYYIRQFILCSCNIIFNFKQSLLSFSNVLMFRYEE